MAKPRQEIDDKEYFKDIHFLYEIIHQLKDVDEVKKFLKDILTPSELRMFKKRWHVTRLLSQGIDIRTIASMAQCGSNTVLTIKRKLEEGNGGLRLALNRMDENLKKEKTNKRKTINSSRFVKGWFK